MYCENYDFEEIVYPEQKPYTTEYSCRIHNPDKYSSFRRQNNAGKHNGKRLDFIYGIKSGKSEIQAIRMPKSDWTRESAQKFCSTKEHESFE